MGENAETEETLTVTEWGEIKKLAIEIMDIAGPWISSPGGREDVRLKIQQLLADKCLAEMRAYNDRLKGEEWHHPDGWTTKHHFTDCSYNWCGRFAGQRRETSRIHDQRSI